MAEQITQVLERPHAQARKPAEKNRFTSLLSRLVDKVHIPSRETAIQRLQRIDASTKEASILLPGEIDFSIQLAQTRGTVDTLFSQTMAAIRTQAPSALAARDEIARLGNTLVGEQRLADQVTEQHGMPFVLKGGRRPGGVYLHDTQHIMYQDRKVTPADKLTALATTGQLPRASQIAAHERTHAVQFSLAADANIPHELTEAQAYRVGAPYDLIDHDKLVQAVVGQSERSPLYADLDTRKFNSAVYLIDSLNALGYSQEGIAQVISHAGEWDEQTGFWPHINKVVETERARRGLDRDGLENLVTVSRLQKSIDISRAKIAAQQVLKDAFRTELEQRKSPRTPHRVKPHHPRHSALYVRSRS